MERKIIYLDDVIDALRYAQHRFTVADEAGGMGTVKWSEDVIYFATVERVLAELPSAQPEQDIEHCATCVHDEDSVEICVLRKCKYAISELIDCYEPKQSERKKEGEHAGKKG